MIYQHGEAEEKALRSVVERYQEEIARLTRENWQLKQALGYPIPAEFDTPQNPFRCGTCNAREGQQSK